MTVGDGGVCVVPCGVTVGDEGVCVVPRDSWGHSGCGFCSDEISAAVKGQVMSVGRFHPFTGHEGP